MPEWIFCFVICFSKIIEIVLSSLKTILLVKGKRVVSTIMAFAEVTLWAFVISGIINDLTSNLYWLISYCVGYAAGYYIGSWIECKLALGTIDVCVVVEESCKYRLINYLQLHNYGYYVESCEGAAGKHVKFDIILPRKYAPRLRKEISSICNNQLFVLNFEVAYRHGGYGNTSRGG